MQESLLERIAPRLRELDKGSYSRVYREGRRTFRTSLQMSLAEILGSLGIKYRAGVKLPGSSIRADFLVNGTYVFVDRRLDAEDTRRLAGTRKKCVLISTATLRSDAMDLGIRAIEMGTSKSDRLQTIFLDDPSFNFDYAHVLPHTQKCSVMHGHTSSALVEIVGRPIDGMVVDFGPAKEIVREAVRDLDHKLFINRKYVSAQDAKSVTLRFKTVHGDFEIKAPRQTTVLMEGEATVENLSNEVLSRIAPKMPNNVTAVGVYVYEGLNKGSHLLAQIHSREVEKRRRPL